MEEKNPLKISDGTPVRTMEELREHFDLAAGLNYYNNGRLKEWLSDRYYDEEAEKVEHLDSSSKIFKKSLCNILGVDYSEDKAGSLDLDSIAKKNERRERLKKYTADDRIFASSDDAIVQGLAEALKNNRCFHRKLDDPERSISPLGKALSKLIDSSKNSSRLV